MENQGYNESITVTRAGAVAAGNRIAGVVTRTPLLPVPGGEGHLWIKA